MTDKASPRFILGAVAISTVWLWLMYLWPLLGLITLLAVMGGGCGVVLLALVGCALTWGDNPAAKGLPGGPKR